MPLKAAASTSKKKAAAAAASEKATAGTPIASSTTKSAIPSKWQWPAPASIEDALKDDPSVSSAAQADDLDPFTGVRVYKSPHRSPAHPALSPAPKKPGAAKKAARRSLDFDDGSEASASSSSKHEKDDDAVAKPRKRKKAAAKAKKGDGSAATSPKKEVTNGKKNKKAAAAATTKKSSEELEAQRKYFDDLDASVKLPEAEPDASQEVKFVLIGSSQSPRRAFNAGAAAASAAAKGDDVSPQSREKELKRRLPNAWKDYETYASVMDDAGVSKMTFDEYVASGADLDALINPDATKVRKSPIKQAPASPKKPASPKAIPPSPSSPPKKITTKPPVAEEEEEEQKPAKGRKRGAGKDEKEKAKKAKPAAKASAKGKKGK